MYINYNANPTNAHVGDCTVRAISKATSQSWDKVYVGLAVVGFCMKDMEDANRVWGEYLRLNGWRRTTIPNDCQCYTVKDFCNEHPKGTFVLAMEGHVLCVQDGNYIDTWDSGEEIPLYYWEEN